MPRPYDLDAIGAVIEGHLRAVDAASIGAMAPALALSPTCLLKALRRLARRGAVWRDPATPLTRNTGWHLASGLPLPPRHTHAGTPKVDGAPDQRRVAALNTGRAQRDPLVAALFGQRPAARLAAPTLAPHAPLDWAPALPAALQPPAPARAWSAPC